MKTEEIRSLFRSAAEDLETADRELQRPSMDVVAFSACISSRRALHKFLKGLSAIYAAEHDETVKPGSTIEDLIAFCSRFNDDLTDIDFSSLDCKCNTMEENEGDEPVYCTSVNRVNYCTNIAKQLKDLITEKQPGLV